METIYIILQHLHQLIVPRIVRSYNSLMQSPYSKPVGLIATSILVIGLLLSFSADLSFMSFSNGIFWDANPNELQLEIENASLQESDNLFDEFYQWIIKNISFKTSAHMLAGNTVAILVALTLLSLVAKEFFSPMGFLPVGHYSKASRYTFGTLAIVAVFSMGFFYIYVLISADHKKFEYNNTADVKELSMEELSSNNIDESLTTIKEVPYSQARTTAFICFGIGMILSTAFALYGAMMFIRILGTILAILFLVVSRFFSQSIEIPYLAVGKRIGAIKLNVADSNPRLPENLGHENRIPNPAGDINDVTENEDDALNTSEEERNHLITKNPLGL